MKKAKYPRISGQTNRAALFRQGVFVLIKTGVIVVVEKNVPVFKRFFLQPLMPQYRHSEHNYGKRYNSGLQSFQKV
jgi:hypothetical protein